MVGEGVRDSYDGPLLVHGDALRLGVGQVAFGRRLLRHGVGAKGQVARAGRGAPLLVGRQGHDDLAGLEALAADHHGMLVGVRHGEARSRKARRALRPSLRAGLRVDLAHADSAAHDLVVHLAFVGVPRGVPVDDGRDRARLPDGPGFLVERARMVALGRGDLGHGVGAERQHPVFGLRPAALVRLDDHDDGPALVGRTAHDDGALVRIDDLEARARERRATLRGRQAGLGVELAQPEASPGDLLGEGVHRDDDALLAHGDAARVAADEVALGCGDLGHGVGAERQVALSGRGASRLVGRQGHDDLAGLV